MSSRATTYVVSVTLLSANRATGPVPRNVAFVRPASFTATAFTANHGATS